jgi:tetratricopeptide (TPR) repeat protein
LRQGVGVASLDNAPRVAYRGFISYSHRDAGIGKSIHRRLEAYRLPKRLIGGETVRGAVPARLTPIFRDREELSAGESLSDQVQAALAGSDCLIVLCSPAAKASKWVAKEIETFRVLYPDRPVLAALIAGEPEEAFPESLIADGAEPIAADFRKGGDGQRLALLKIVAGMTAVPLDALVQRDAQRQMRRVMAITLTALLAVLTMALLLVMAVRAEREAKRQRQQAEGLVEYMLTDLRDRLKGVGRLDVMTAVNERAMGYYGAQGDLDTLPPESLDRRARILHAMGEDDEKRGNLDLALRKFEEAHRASKAVMKQKPNDPDATFAHSQSEYWIGYILQKRGNLPLSIAHYRQYLLLSQKLSTLEPRESTHRATKNIGWAHNSIGIVLFHDHLNLNESQTHFKSYLTIFSKMLLENRHDSAIEFSVADAHAWIADVEFERSNFIESSINRKNQIEILDDLLKTDPGNDVWRWAWIAANRSLFRICFRQQDYRCAERAINTAGRWTEKQSYDVNNRNWLWQAAYVALDRAYLDKRLGRSATASRDEALNLAIKYRILSDSKDKDNIELFESIKKLQ